MLRARASRRSVRARRGSPPSQASKRPRGVDGLGGSASLGDAVGELFEEAARAWSLSSRTPAQDLVDGRGEAVAAVLHPDAASAGAAWKSDGRGHPLLTSCGGRRAAADARPADDGLRRDLVHRAAPAAAGAADSRRAIRRRRLAELLDRRADAVLRRREPAPSPRSRYRRSAAANCRASSLPRLEAGVFVAHNCADVNCAHT